MRKRRFSSDDSLDMLLDALCNVFGGIILVACLLALLGGGEPEGAVKADESPAGLAVLQATERRLKAAEEELRGLKDLHRKLSKDDDGEAARLAAERDALRQTQERLRAELAAKDTPAEKTGGAASTEDVEKLRKEVRDLEKLIADARAKKLAAELTEKDLLARLEQLKKLLKENADKNTEYVRFPKEKDSGRPFATMILKFGCMYPLTAADGQPFPGVRRKPVPGREKEEAFSATPVPSAGWRLPDDRAAIREYFAAAKRSGCFSAVHLFPDSFEMFRALRPYFAEAGVEFGFEILPQHYLLIFSTTGTKLKEL